MKQNMKQDSQPCKSRRQLCGDAVRYLALGGIGLLSGGLIVKRVNLARANECVRPGAAALPSAGQAALCRGCAALVQCALPPATAARKLSGT